MLKLPKSHKRTFDQIEYSKSIDLLEKSYYTLSLEKIEEIHSLSPDIISNKSYRGMTPDEARYFKLMDNLRNSYYTLPQETIDKVRRLANSL